MKVTVRAATAADVEAICTIHNQGIVDRIATLDTILRTTDDCRAWLEERGLRHPVLVADLEGLVVGWASLNRFNPRQAYDHVADFSVYVEREWRGKGGGPARPGRPTACARGAGDSTKRLAPLAPRMPR